MTMSNNIPCHNATHTFCSCHANCCELQKASVQNSEHLGLIYLPHVIQWYHYLLHSTALTMYLTRTVARSELFSLF